jgi:hypothetical protein
MFHDCVNARFKDPGMFRDRALLNEMRAFHVDPETNRPEASEDEFDDRIIALSIAHRVAADEVLWSPGDVYLNYEDDKEKTPAQKFIDHINKSDEQIYGGRDPVDIVNRLVNRGFDLDDDANIYWHPSSTF